MTGGGKPFRVFGTTGMMVNRVYLGAGKLGGVAFVFPFGFSEADREKAVLFAHFLSLREFRLTGVGSMETELGGFVPWSNTRFAK
jgi:hypothetical protein